MDICLITYIHVKGAQISLLNTRQTLLITACITTHNLKHMGLKEDRWFRLTQCSRDGCVFVPRGGA